MTKKRGLAHAGEDRSAQLQQYFSLFGHDNFAAEQAAPQVFSEPFDLILQVFLRHQETATRSGSCFAMSR